MKRMLAILLTALMTLSAAACGSAGEAPAATAVPETAENTETTAVHTVYDDLPSVSYDGRDFRILTRDAAHHTKEVYAEAMNGEVVNDAVFARNAAVCDKFNIKISTFEVPEDDEMTLNRQVTASVMAGDNDFQVALSHTVNAGSTALEGVLYNWMDMPYNDFSRDWWNSVLAEELCVNGNLYLAVSDFCFSTVDYTWVMVYNKQLAEDYGLGSLYETVESGKWTLDRFTETISVFSEDLNGDGAYDFEDRYGFATHFNSAICNWMFALGQKVVDKDANGEYFICCNTPKMTSIVEKMYDILYNGNRSLYCTDAKVKAYGAPSHDMALAMLFSDGHAFISALRIQAIENLRASDTDFGIIPFPMWDEAQDGYHTHVDGHAPLMLLPRNLEDPEFASAIIEALSYESNARVMPAVYEVVLDSKYARDEKSVEMLDLILNGRVYTFGYIYDAWKGMQWALTNLMSSGSSDYASYYAKNENSALTQLADVLESFESIDD